MNTKAIIEAGGKEWTQSGMRRFYFDAAALAGLPFKSHNGRAYDMDFDGRILSGAKSDQIARCLRGSKVWIDAEDGKVYTSVIGCNALGSDSGAEALKDRMIDALAIKLPGIEVA